MQTKNELLAGGILDHSSRGISKHLDDAHEQVHFIVAREERMPGKEFRQNATQAPHVNVGVVRKPQDDLRRAIKSALDVCVNWRKKEDG